MSIARATIPYRPAVYIGCVVLALACNYILGKDMAWDTLNYHLYAGFNALNDRFSQDYFPAGPPSYFNPFAYIPFYLMVSAGLPALLIGSVFAAVHSVVLWLTFELGVAVCPSADNRTRVFAGVCAAGLAFVNPIMMQQIGSCFADITTAELALAGWVLLAGAVLKPRISPIICAGLVLGAASALKLSNALHAISAFGILLLLPLTWRGLIRYGAIYGASLGVGFAGVAAPWSYRLWKRFGNPMFPMLNDIFRSPEFMSEPGYHFRFIPGTLLEALWRPFAMIDPVPRVHEELVAPDLRYAVLVVLLVILCVRWLRRRLKREPAPSIAAPPGDSTRVLAALGCGLGIDWLLYLRLSGNSRYFLTTACVAAVVIIGLLFELFPKRPKVRNYILAGMFGVQVVQLSMAAEFRWNGVPWGGPWFDLTIPAKLRTEPDLFLTMGTQSNSFLVPYLAPQSGYINFAGGYTLAPDGANGARVKALILRSAPRLRVIVAGEKLYDDAERRAPRRSAVDDSLLQFGLRTDPGDCATIIVHGLPPEIEIRYKTSAPLEPQSRDTSYLVSCRVVADTTDRSAAQIARRKTADLVLDRLEDACPELFSPRRTATVYDGDSARRGYGGSSDLSAWVSWGWVKFSDPMHFSNGLVFLGRESDWAKAPLRLDCGRRNGRYYARVVGAQGSPGTPP